MRSIRAKAERFARVMSGVVLAMTGIGCSRELPAPLGGHVNATPERGGTLRLATFADLRSLDPANISDGVAPMVIEHLFAGLVDYDEAGTPRPDLAERWVIEDEGRTYRFFLRQHARFHDGEEVTANDVKRSVERALHGSAPNPAASYYAGLVGFDDFRSKKTESLEGVRVEGTYVVSFHLTEPDATFLQVIALQPLRPVCRGAGTRWSDAWHPCGAGPFKLREGGWQHGHSLEVVRHDGYFKPGLPYLDAIRWSLHENPNSQSFQFFRGDLDIMREFASPELLRLQADPRWKPFGEFGGSPQVIGEAMNVELAPFDNVEVRRAVASAIDRDALRRIRAASLSVTNQLVPPGVFGHDPEMEGQRSDLSAALEHMRRAGYPFDPVTKTGGWPHVIPYVVYKQGLQEYMGQVLAQQLERIGLHLEMRVVNYPTWMALRGRRKAMAFGPGFWSQDFPDAVSFLEPLFHSKSIAEEDSTNWSFYRNPRFDELVDRSHRELDSERRQRLYSEAQKILADDAPWAFTVNYRSYTQRQGYVRDSPTHPMWNVQATRTWLDRLGARVTRRALFEGGREALLAGAP